ncbi:MAG: ABC transporter substrate-binding protein [Actinomycetaceae bacterium]
MSRASRPAPTAARTATRARTTATITGRAALLAATALVLSACAGADGAEGGGGDGEPQVGGTLRVGLNTEVACADPHQNSSNVVIFVTRQIADSLTDQDPETGEIVPWLASDWEVNDDATQYTFTLRDDITFSDGTPLDAEAVAANFDTIIEEGPAVSPLATTYLDGYASAEAIDATTLQVNFDRPNVQFLQGTATVTLGILSPATLEATPEERCAGDVVASGPFVYDSYVPDSEVVLTAREEYDWSSDVAQHDGRAYLDAIEFPVLPESGVRSGQLRSGELDVDTIPLTEDVPGFEGNGFGVTGRPYPGVAVNLIPNLERPLTSDVNVRRAVLLGTDREELVGGLFTEYDQVATSVITSETPLFEPVEGIEYNPEEAAALLEESGWELGADGIRERDGERLTLRAVYHLGRQAEPMMELLQSQLREIGIDLQLVLGAPGDLAQLEADGEWDLWYTPFHRAEADSARAVFGINGRNQNRADEERPVDELLQAQSEETDESARTRLITEASQELVDEAYAIPLYELAGVMTYRDVVHDFTFEASSRLWLYDTWIEQ